MIGWFRVCSAEFVLFRINSVVFGWDRAISEAIDCCRSENEWFQEHSCVSGWGVRIISWMSGWDLTILIVGEVEVTPYGGKEFGYSKYKQTTRLQAMISSSFERRQPSGASKRVTGALGSKRNIYSRLVAKGYEVGGRSRGHYPLKDWSDQIRQVWSHFGMETV